MKYLFLTALLIGTTLAFAQTETRLLTLNGTELTDVETLNQVEGSCYIGEKQIVKEILIDLIEPSQLDDIAIDVEARTSSSGQEYLEVTVASYGCFHDGGSNCEGSFHISKCN